VECPNFKGNHIAFSSECAKKAEDTRETLERRRREPAGSNTKTGGPRVGANKTVLSLRPKAPKGGERGGSEEEKADAEQGGAKAQDVTIVESLTPTPMATPAPSATGESMTAGTIIEPKNVTGVIAPNV
jgi:hypothetical protein